MPIVDGFSSAKMIRSFEKTQSSTCLSSRASRNGRIPIFAVSASLVERDRDKYIRAGFDGWILKPVDFKRVDLLLRGIVNDEIRDGCIYAPGKWEQGGWFAQRNENDDMYSTNTEPSQQIPTLEVQRAKEEGRITDLNASEGSVTPTQYPATPNE